SWWASTSFSPGGSGARHEPARGATVTIEQAGASVTGPAVRPGVRPGIYRRTPRANRIRGGPGLGTYLTLAMLLLVSAFPLYWSVVVASQDESAIAKSPPAVVPGPHLWE